MIEGEKRIRVYICEDDELAKKIAQDHFGKGITYVHSFREESREMIVEALDKIEE